MSKLNVPWPPQDPSEVATKDYVDKNLLASQDLTLELNGVANIAMILYGYEDQIPAEIKADIREQLDILERYMIELTKAAREGRKNAYWHEVRENKQAYPKREQT